MLPPDQKHWSPTGSHVCEIHHANVAHLTKTMEAYYSSRSWMYTEKTLQVSCYLLGWEHANCDLASAFALEAAKG